MDLRWNILAPYAPLFISGVQMTIKLTVIALVLGLAAGMMIGLVTSRKPKGWRRIPHAILTAYVGVLRGTPLFVQILLVHFALTPTLIHPETGLLLTGEAASTFRQTYGAFFSGALALTLNASAYISEIVRAGILGVSPGQTRAAKALGLTPTQTMIDVVMPQAIRIVIPALGNSVNGLLKTQIAKLAKNYEYLIIDNEAGMENMSRGTLGKVDLLLLISDCSKRGIRTVARLRDLAEELDLKIPEIGLIVNRAPNGSITEAIGDEIENQNLKLVGIVPQDDAVFEYDSYGQPLVTLPDDSKAKNKAYEIFRELGL